MSECPYRPIPVPPERFVGRSSELFQTLDWIQRGYSVAVVGQPRIGRTSLLRALEAKATVAKYLGSEAERFIFHYVDLLKTARRFDAVAFWEDIRSVLSGVLHANTSKPLTALSPASELLWSRRSPKHLFTEFGHRGYCLVLMLDEIDVWLDSTSPGALQTFGLLCALLRSTNSLLLLVSRRGSPEDVQRSIKEIDELKTVIIRPFRDPDINALLDLPPSEFTPDERDFIRRVAGRHPWLLQCAAQTLFELKDAKADWRKQAELQIRSSTEVYFREIWETLSERTKNLALELQEITLHGAGQDNESVFERSVPVADPIAQLGALERLGLAQQGARGKWSLIPEAFVWWLDDSGLLEPRTSTPSGVTILHLSDTHLGTQEEAYVQSQQIKDDLTLNMGVHAIDYLLVSGDIAHRSAPEDYVAAEDYVGQLGKVNENSGHAPMRVVLAPGNHDMDWRESRKAYRLGCLHSKLKLPRWAYQSPRLRKPIGAILRALTTVLRDNKHHPKRFQNFALYYSRVCDNNKVFPEEYDRQGLLHPYYDHRIVFLTLNSCWEIDHCYREQASVNPVALSHALARDWDEGYQGWLKIAVWHHPVSAGEPLNDAFLERLATHGFQVGIHGHIHRPEGHLFKYDRKGLEIIGAGTCGGEDKDRPPDVPYQYNFLVWKADAEILDVRTREKENRNGAWKEGTRPAPYPIYLKRHAVQHLV